MNLKEQVIKKSALSPTVLIAGGAGFIGSHLAERLLIQNARVIVIDNFKTGKDVYLSALQKNPKFALFDADINVGIPEKIQSVDYIIHLAGVESYLYSRDQLNLDSLLTNAVGTKNLLDLAHRSEAKFLMVSSIDVYEGIISPLNLDQYFGDTPEEESRYSMSEAKRFAEALVWEYYKRNQTDVRITRIPEVYGPRMNLASSGSLGAFLKDSMEHRDLTIYGEGTQREYYIYITDAINGLIKALFNNHTKGQIFTLAPEEPYVVLELAYLVKSLADSELQVNFKPKVSREIFRTPRIPDRGNLHALKWEPKIDLKEGVKKTMEWFGYQPNENSFKPQKFIDQKIQQKEIAKGNLVGSLAGGLVEPEVQRPVENFTIAPDLPVEEEIQKVEKPKKQKKPKKERKKIAFPKISLFKKREKSAGIPIVKPMEKQKPVKTPKQIKPRSGMSGVPAAIAALIVALLIFAVLPFAQAAIYTRGAVKDMGLVAETLPQLKTEEASGYAEKAFQKFYKAQKAMSRGRWAFTVAGKKATYDSLINTISSAKYFSKATYDVTKAAAPFSNLWETIKPNTENTFNAEEFSQAQLKLSEAKNNFLRAQAEFKNVDISVMPEKYSGEISMYGNALAMAVENIDTVSALAVEIPNLLGANDNLQRYLVLFQNSNEMRPTGGFIGSYAVIEIENGKIKNLTIDDIYNPDGQIDVRNIQVEPPAVLAELLDEDRHYIRNANWNPDFNFSATDIKDLYFKVTGKEVAGVIAVDLKFAENMLNVTGPIYLTAFGEEISAENLYERTQHHSEFNYENGSDQKKAFLTILGSKLLEGIFALSEEDIPNLLTQTGKALEEKHLLISLSNNAFSAELNKKTWDGSLVSTDPSVQDYLYVVNANVGGTKANYFVQNEMRYLVESKTRDGLLRGTLELKYIHTGEDNSWPGGPYKNYIRVLTQNGAKLTGATFGFEGSQAQDVFEEMIIGKEDGYESFEKLIAIEPQQTGILTLTYDLPVSLSITKDSKEYDLYWQKQPGTAGDPAGFTFEAPFGLQTYGDAQVQTNLDTDKTFKVTLQ